MNKGFTLLEIMLTIVTLVVGTMSLIQVFSNATYADAQIQKRMIALHLAQEKMEEIKGASDYASIDSFESARANLGGDFAEFDREVSVSTDPKEVRINVYWGIPGEEQSLGLVTLMADVNY